jgi:LPPG:FO 2-phospho-L-lactate transferase
MAPHSITVDPELNVVALAGGVGGAKLAHGLAQILAADKLTVIVNTGDDFEHLGLHISPDLDTVMYTVAGLANPDSGWGLAGESWRVMETLERLSGPTWFNLGDRDLATHLLRTHWLGEGYPLTWVTQELGRRLGVEQALLPMSDDPVRTRLDTDQGLLEFQDYFVRRHWQPVVHGIHFEGATLAQPTRQVVNAIRLADLIVFCPSNPLVSIDPILAVSSLRRLIAASRVPKVAVSPIVAGAALRGPAAKMMAELGMPASPVGVARHLGDVLTGLVIDQQDAGAKVTIATEAGLPTLVTDIVMSNDPARARLAREVVGFALSLRR